MRYILEEIDRTNPDNTAAVIQLIKTNSKSREFTEEIKLLALNKAVHKDLTDIVAALIDINIDLNIQLDTGETLRAYATKKLYKIEAIETKLIDYEIKEIKSTIDVSNKIDKVGNKSQKTLLMIAAQEGNLIRVKALLKLGASIDTRCNKMSQGKTALMLAAMEGKEEIVKYLLLKGADAQLKTIPRERDTSPPKSIPELIKDEYGPTYDNIRRIISNAMNTCPNGTSETLKQQYHRESEELLQMKNILKLKQASLETIQTQISKFQTLIIEKEKKLTEIKTEMANKKQVKLTQTTIVKSDDNQTITLKRSPETLPTSIADLPTIFNDPNNKRQKTTDLNKGFNFDNGVIDDLEKLI